jgi:hypothetical protein
MMEHSSLGRKVHRYDRVERFKTVLMHLLGGRGVVPKEVLERVEDEIIRYSVQTVWLDVQKILRKNGNFWYKNFEQFRLISRSEILTKLGDGKYFNRIPYILRFLGFKPKIVFTGSIVDLCMIDFVKMSSRFDAIKDGLTERKYFPSLRYVALRLLEIHGTTFEYEIPLVKTPCKVKVLDDIFITLFQAQ